MEESELIAVTPVPEPDVRAQQQAEFTAEKMARAAAPPAAPSIDEDQRFSLTSLIVLLTLACVVFAIGRSMPTDIFAGILGLITVSYLALLSVLRVTRMSWHVAWWTLLTMYIAAVVVAIVRKSS